MALEAKIARLELESLTIQNKIPATTVAELGRLFRERDAEVKAQNSQEADKMVDEGEGGRAARTDAHESPDDKVTITRAKVAAAEVQFAKLVHQINNKANECLALEEKLAQMAPIPVIDMSEEQAAERWVKLRDLIAKFALEHLNKTFDPKMISEACQRDLIALSPHWKSYTSTKDLPNLIFRAWIWRWLLRFFDIFCRAYGREISRKLSDIAGNFYGKVTDAEFRDWRIRTANLAHRVYKIDQSLIEEVTQKILEQITPIIESKDTTRIHAAMHEIVQQASELSEAFDRSNYLPLMCNEPGGTLLHSFPHSDRLMVISKKLGTKGVVDLMIAPVLLKRDYDYTVLVKADIASG
ncbi:hypothetical protein GGR50DRAFT_640801 [Xylaria sp. CBS 124048]|nr:hypothetical protein GGR50DRAFT_640801 [Xylaria sp. CBS 124048]